MFSFVIPGQFECLLRTVIFWSRLPFKFSFLSFSACSEFTFAPQCFTSTSVGGSSVTLSFGYCFRALVEHKLGGSNLTHQLQATCSPRKAVQTPLQVNGRYSRCTITTKFMPLSYAVGLLDHSTVLLASRLQYLLYQHLEYNAKEKVVQ